MQPTSGLWENTRNGGKKREGEKTVKSCTQGLVWQKQYGWVIVPSRPSDIKASSVTARAFVKMTKIWKPFYLQRRKKEKSGSGAGRPNKSAVRGSLRLNNPIKNHKRSTPGWGRGDNRWAVEVNTGYSRHFDKTHILKQMWKIHSAAQSHPGTLTCTFARFTHTLQRLYRFQRFLLFFFF